MSDNKRLSVSVISVTSSQLEIKVKNTSGAALTDSLEIEFRPAMYLVDKRIRDASEKAPNPKSKPRNKTTLDGVVAVAPGWSAWAMRESSGTVAIIQVFNYYDQKTGEILDTPIKFEADAELTLRVPLNTGASQSRGEMTYNYLYGDDDKRVGGTLEVIPSGSDDWKPDVKLNSDQASPTMIKLGTKVKISWAIKDGVSATLRGPLPGGTSELTLSDSDPNFKIKSGSFEILAVGPLTYMLQAQVRRGDNKPNEQVVRMLSLDTYRREKYTFVGARPNRVLPNGLVEIDWAAWGVKAVTLLINGSASRKIPLTEQNAFRTYQGTGVMRFTSRETKVEHIDLEIEIGDEQPRTDATTKVSVVSWEKQTKPRFSGKPIGLAVADGRMALLTGDGLYTAKVGDQDVPVVIHPIFDKAVTDAPKAWLALAASDTGFVALRRTSKDGLQVARYKSDGKTDDKLLGTPVDLPDTVQDMVRRSDTIYDLAVISEDAASGPRVVVVVETPVPNGSLRRAFWVRFKPQAELRTEPLLESLARYRLVTFDDALYALSRESGRMFRFGVTKEGKLERPSETACAAEDRRSMIQQGLFAPVGRVFAVLSPTSVPSLESLALFGLRNVLGYESLIDPEDPNKIPQDLVYNPQTGRWARCGRGLEIQTGAVTAYRGGDSPRLWVLQPDGEIHTLAAKSEHIFAGDFVTRFPTKDLTPYLDSKREFTIVNMSGVDLVPVDDTCRMAGLDDFSASVPVELTPMREPFPQGNRRTIAISYNKAGTDPVKLRFMGKEPPAAGPRYVLEMTFSGPGLSAVSTVFKRLAIDAKGAVSILEVPGTSAQHTALSVDNPITVPDAARLSGNAKLVIANVSPYDLTLTPSSQAPPFRSFEEVVVRHNTPALSISSPRLGELRFDIDCALPPGIETSSGNVAQQRQIRINPDKATGMEIRLARMLSSGEVFNLQYQLDGTIPVRADQNVDKRPVYVCQVGFGLKSDLPAIYIGDGVSNTDDRYFYLPIALPQDPSKAQIFKVDSETLAYTASDSFAGGKLFSLPNAVGLSSNKVFAMFGDTDLYELSQSLQVSKKTSFALRNARTSWPLQLKPTVGGGIYLLTKRKDFIDRYEYVLLADGTPRKPAEQTPFPPRENTDTRTEMSMSDLVSLPRDFGNPQGSATIFNKPMAVSPDGKVVAVGFEGGIKIVYFSVSNPRPDFYFLDCVAEAAHVVFSDNGYIYCAHYPSRTVGLRISRIEVANPRNLKTISLPTIEGDFNIGPDPSKFGTTEEELNHARAISLAVAPDGHYLYVSHGRSILQIFTQRMEVLPWRATVDLPCRLITVKKGPAYRANNRDIFTDLVYAIGAKVVSDGKKVSEHKTQLYALAAPK